MEDIRQWPMLLEGAKGLSGNTQVSTRIAACLGDIQSWMDSHHLKLNPGKTELIFIPALNSPHLDFFISLGDTLVTSSPCAKNLGVVMDNRLSLSMNIAAFRVCVCVLWARLPSSAFSDSLLITMDLRHLRCLYTCHQLSSALQCISTPVSHPLTVRSLFPLQWFTPRLPDSLPVCPLPCLRTCPLTRLPACLPAYLSCLPPSSALTIASLPQSLFIINNFTNPQCLCLHLGPISVILTLITAILQYETNVSHK
ncbi:hypothetical protein AAFF_G00179430 [Aldrovandia affinis]|uniref:Reverse transcriptase domain-containing protein n=1 Tax=Aldrovandia affinis TaxID=143900 RepID=A0AAD7RKM6_9TELE|nr:hypothetical protein AAFF_G00179430 [Aldrovandia affinis]